MYDRQTDSLWPQLTGRAAVGTLTGTRLTAIPIGTVAWRDLQAAHPRAWVLSRDTGHSRPYGQNPYTGYDNPNGDLLFDTPNRDARLPVKVPPELIGRVLPARGVAMDDPMMSSASTDAWGMRRTGSTLIVGQGLHRSEVARFWSHVVAGPRGDDCWFWAGAIADDGYGWFWITGDGRPRVVRPHRDALALALRQPLVESVVAAHEVCDNPICVRADGSGRDHVVACTQPANLQTMGRRRRGGGCWWTWRWAGSDRAGLAVRSRAIRTALADGWDDERLAAAAAFRPSQEGLW